jgi:hypothetical protein
MTREERHAKLQLLALHCETASRHTACASAILGELAAADAEPRLPAPIDLAERRAAKR